MQTITVKEALEQGYTQCGYDGTDFQHLKQISELESDDFEENYRGKLVVAGTDSNSVSIDKTEILDFLTDRYYDESPDDDTHDIQVCFEEQSEKIEQFVSDMNEIYSKKEWFYLTEIQLLP